MFRQEKTLREYRLYKGLTQATVADLLGISVSHYCNIENGHRGIRYQTAKKLAACYGISVDRVYESLEASSRTDLDKINESYLFF